MLRELFFRYNIIQRHSQDFLSFTVWFCRQKSVWRPIYWTSSHSKLLTTACSFVYLCSQLNILFLNWYLNNFERMKVLDWRNMFLSNINNNCRSNIYYQLEGLLTASLTSLLYLLWEFNDRFGSWLKQWDRTHPCSHFGKIIAILMYEKIIARFDLYRYFLK